MKRSVKHGERQAPSGEGEGWGGGKRDLKTAVASPGFTPSVRDVDGLVALLHGSDGDAEVRSAVERALGRLGDALLPAVRERWEAAPKAARVHLVRAVARVKQGGEALALFLRALDDDAPQVRRAAARALGKLRGEDAVRAEQALLAAWRRGGLSLEEQRAFAAALGTLGSKEAAPLLAALLLEQKTQDPELARIASRAQMMIARTHLREAGGGSDASIAAPGPLPIVFHVRRGLEPLCKDELESSGDWGPLKLGSGWVRGLLQGPLERAWAARTALSFALVVEPPDADIARLLTSEEARRIFTTWTQGPIRYRLAWSEGGHQRARVWQIAREVAEREPAFVNDPTASLWEVRVRPARDPAVTLELVPRGLDDPRFTYRVRDVPAASHPTIAAALVRAAGAREDDVVWDPFAGSGMELCERARLGGFAALYGTDLEEKALIAARANLESAGIDAARIKLVKADATRWQPPAAPTLILTNPPMGLRVARTKELGAMLDRFLVHASNVLAPGGRLAWLSPFPERTRRALLELPLDVALTRDVDLGGFWAALQVLVKRPAPGGVGPKKKRPA